MFLNAVILILQEVLEAALLVTVLLVLAESLHRYYGQPFVWQRSWLLIALVMGLAGGWLYASLMPAVSQWFDYVGQEVTNSLIHLLSLACLLAVAYLPSHRQTPTANRSRYFLLPGAMIVIVFLALMREGSEIIIYLQGVGSQQENLASVLLGGTIGAGIGLSCGIILYYALLTPGRPWTLRLCVALLALVTGNMASQIIMLLSQADWLPYTAIAWNSSALISESSVTGHLLYALIGYEATPSILQAASYLTGIIVIIPSPLSRKAWANLNGFHNHASQT